MEDRWEGGDEAGGSWDEDREGKETDGEEAEVEVEVDDAAGSACEATLNVRAAVGGGRCLRAARPPARVAAAAAESTVGVAADIFASVAQYDCRWSRQRGTHGRTSTGSKTEREGWKEAR